MIGFVSNNFKMWSIWFIALILPFCQGKLPKITVIEYEESRTNNFEADLKYNTAEYLKQIALIGEQDLIIFPECTIINSTDHAVVINLEQPCSGTKCPEPLNALSLMAQLYTTYLVVNVVEKEKCAVGDLAKNCQNFGFRYYNTDIVFDRTGVIIKKYRKYNLYGEYNLNRPLEAEQVIIDFDFGFRLGLMTCFDLMFKSPAVDLVGKVDGIIYPHQWFSELPFMVSLQVQQMFAHEHDILLFSAGANSVTYGNGGSGIYDGARGAVANGIVIEGTTKSFNLASKPLKQNPKAFDTFPLKEDPNVVQFTSILLDLTADHIEEDVKFDENFTCHFNIELAKKPIEKHLQFYQYHLAAFSGINLFDDVYNGGLEVCALLACLDSSVSSCGKRFSDYDQVQWPVAFESIEISADFEKTGNRTQYPSSVLSSLRPIDTLRTQWTSTETNGKIRRTFSTWNQTEIYTFGIYGRNFDLDFGPPRE